MNKKEQNRNAKQEIDVTAVETGTEREIPVNKKYKDTDALQIVTLENAVYLGYKNDVAFLIGNCLNLYEHQSTFNPNLPLRDLFYIAHEYQMLVESKTLYLSVLQKLPTPKFVVFYNGKRNIGEQMLLKLSDSYEIITEEPQLELKVIMININAGFNKKLMEQCQVLKEYAEYVACVRRYTDGMPLEKAVSKAVDECIHRGILAEFLRKHRSEVISVSIFEYDKEIEEEKLRKAEFEAGEQIGLKRGEKRLALLIAELIQAGRTNDLLKVTEDENYRESLYQEYHL